MKLIPVKVKTYSGYKADEHPVSVVQDNKEIFVTGVIDRWYQGDLNPDFHAADYFKVKTSGNSDMLIKHDLGNDSWYLCIPD